LSNVPEKRWKGRRGTELGSETAVTRQGRPAEAFRNDIEAAVAQSDRLAAHLKLTGRLSTSSTDCWNTQTIIDRVRGLLRQADGRRVGSRRITSSCCQSLGMCLQR